MIRTCLLFLSIPTIITSFLAPLSCKGIKSITTNLATPKSSSLFTSVKTPPQENQEIPNSFSLTNNFNLSTSFDIIANSRYACTRFLRNPSSNLNSTSTTPNPEILQKAKEALQISQRAPTGFNAQPYKAILVSDPHTKSQVSEFCLGRNADRVRDSDCTVIFLADCQCLRTFSKLRILLEHSSRPLSKWAYRKIQLLIGLFSSGYPLPRILSNFVSYIIRTAVTLVGIGTRHKILVPSLATSETWASKNTMLFAMMYMLSCSSKNVVTCPMEGYQAAGIKKVLNIPQGGRFKIPLIVSTGLPYRNEERDDAGMSHGRGGKQERYAFDQTVFENDEFHV